MHCIHCSPGMLTLKHSPHIRHSASESSFCCTFLFSLGLLFLFLFTFGASAFFGFLPRGLSALHVAFLFFFLLPYLATSSFFLDLLCFFCFDACSRVALYGLAVMMTVFPHLLDVEAVSYTHLTLPTIYSV